MSRINKMGAMKKTADQVMVSRLGGGQMKNSDVIGNSQHSCQPLIINLSISVIFICLSIFHHVKLSFLQKRNSPFRCRNNVKSMY